MPNLIILSFVRSQFFRASQSEMEHFLIAHLCQIAGSQGGAETFVLMDSQIVEMLVMLASSHLIESRLAIRVWVIEFLSSIAKTWLEECGFHVLPYITVRTLAIGNELTVPIMCLYERIRGRSFNQGSCHKRKAEFRPTV